MSRAQLANAAGISLSTLDKGLSGQRPFTLATLVRIEDVLNDRIRAASVQTPARQAASELGAYRREGVEWLTGTYLTLRPSFEQVDAAYAYFIDVAWDDVADHLIFRERARQDAAFAQKGAVSLPYQSGQVYLITNEHGQLRLITLGRPSIAGNMYGLLSTLRADRGNRLTPVACPIALLRVENGSSSDDICGRVSVDNPAYALYRSHLDKVCDDEFGVIVS